MEKDLNLVRERGNKLFRSGSYEEAIEEYNKGCEMIKKHKNANKDLLEQKCVFNSNKAACFLKLGKPKEGVACCNEAIFDNPLWGKSYRRRLECFKAIKETYNNDTTKDEANDDRKRATCIVTTAPASYNKVAAHQKVVGDIKTALVNAENDEVIFIETGTYEMPKDEPVEWSARNISLIGANTTKTIIKGIITWESTVRGLIKRLTIDGTIANNNYNLTMEDVLIRHGLMKVLPSIMMNYHAKIKMNYCFLVGDKMSTIGILCKDLAYLEMDNCWVDGHYRGVTVDNSTGVLKNCTLSNCLLYGYQQDPRGDLTSDDVPKELFQQMQLNKNETVRNNLTGCYFLDNNKRLKAPSQSPDASPIREPVFAVGFSHAESVVQNCYFQWSNAAAPVSMDSQLVDKYFVNGLRIQGKVTTGEVSNCLFENYGWSFDPAIPGAGSAGLVIHSPVNFSVTNNKFSNCCIGLSLSSGTTTAVADNIFTDCDQGVQISRSKPTLSSNILTRCSEGAVAFDRGSAGSHSRNTLTQCGGGFVIQDGCFPLLDKNVYKDCVEQPVKHVYDTELALGYRYLLLSMEEAKAVKQHSGKEATPVDYKFICDEDKEKRFAQSEGSKFAKVKICCVCYFSSAEVMTCNGCNMANYCSETCQRKDWPTHSKNCQKFPNKSKKKKGEKTKKEERT